MVLNPLSLPNEEGGSLTGTGSLAIESGILGAVLVTANGTNDATIIVSVGGSSRG